MLKTWAYKRYFLPLLDASEPLPVPAGIFSFNVVQPSNDARRIEWALSGNLTLEGGTPDDEVRIAFLVGAGTGDPASSGVIGIAKTTLVTGNQTWIDFGILEDLVMLPLLGYTIDVTVADPLDPPSLTGYLGLHATYPFALRNLV